MEPRIEMLTLKKLVGMSMVMSLTNNKTGELWRSFITRRQEIQNQIGNDFYSVQLYDQTYFVNFDPHTKFEKWATIEVSEVEQIPTGMKTLVLPAGLYAVFVHQGAASNGPATFYYIFGTWLPNSEYLLDDRPHFEILGKKYKNDDPSSEEEIWIPIRPK